jgi:hypothetical protein
MKTVANQLSYKILQTIVSNLVVIKVFTEAGLINYFHASWNTCHKLFCCQHFFPVNEHSPLLQSVWGSLGFMYYCIMFLQRTAIKILLEVSERSEENFNLFDIWWLKRFSKFFKATCEMWIHLVEFTHMYTLLLIILPTSPPPAPCWNRGSKNYFNCIYICTYIMTYHSCFTFVMGHLVNVDRWLTLLL